MKAEKWREMAGDELVQKAKELNEELFNLRFQLATGQLDNPMRVKEVRHDIARIMTELTEREMTHEDQDAGEAEEAS